MKNTIILISLIISLSISFCKKANKGRDHSSYTSKAQPFSLSKITDAMILRIRDTMQAERDTFYYYLNKLYPGLQSQMQKDAETMIHETDSATVLILLQNFFTNYHAKVDDAWKISGINSQKISNKYHGILGNIPIKIGEYGTMSIVETIASESALFDFPDNVQTTGNMKPVKSGGCGVAADETIQGLSTNYVTMSMRSVDAGGCNVDIHHYDTLIPPDKVYKYLVASFHQPNSIVGNRSVSVGGVSCAESTVSLHIFADGVEMNKRDIAQVITVAPIAWYAEANLNVPSYGAIAISDDTKLPNKKYTVYRRMHCKTGAGGIFSVSAAWNYLFKGDLQLTLSK